LIFKCKQCSKCCVDIPLTKKELAMFKFLIQALNMPSITNRIEEYDRHGLKYKLLGTCPFLNNENKCNIYDFKPHICDIFPLTDNCIGYRQDNTKEDKDE